MKKILFLILALFLLLTVSCEKEPIPLSDYVIGEWVSNEVEMDTDADGNVIYATFEAEFKTTGMYILKLTVDDMSLTLPEAIYIVDDENDIISIAEPEFDDETVNSGDPIMVPFKVTRSDRSDMMTWVSQDEQMDAPTLIWSKK